ncbi:MAG: oligosaccharide flippase family protein [Lachnospiraceae bacterium]|nr:oligosaccharide flippase family protein [Lachnospiraceae bacterium]
MFHTFINAKNILLKEDPNASTVKIAVWYIIGNLFAKGVVMVSTPVFTRLLSKNEYGQFSNLVSWESIIVVFATLDFATSITRAKYDFERRMNRYVSSILLFSNFVTLAILFSIEINQDFFVKLFSMDIIYIRMLFIYLLFTPAFSYLQIKHRVYKKYKFFVLFSISSAIIRTFISVILVLTMTDKLLGRIYGYFLPVTLFNLILWLVILAEGKGISWDCIKYACKISIPLIPHTLSSIVLGNSDRIMITKYCGSESTALYSLAYTISTMASLLWTSMNQAWSPWLFDKMNDKNTREISDKSKIYLDVFFVLIIGVLLVTPEIILILGGKSYYSARYIMPPVIAGCTFQFIYGMYVNIEVFSKKTFAISIGTTAAATINIFLNRLFIPKYGYMAAAYTTMFGYFVLLAFHYCMVKVKIKEYSNIYNESHIFLIMLLNIVTGILSLILYKHNYIRYALVFMYSVIILLVMLNMIKYKTK